MTVDSIVRANSLFISLLRVAPGGGHYCASPKVFPVSENVGWVQRRVTHRLSVRIFADRYVIPLLCQSEGFPCVQRVIQKMGQTLCFFDDNAQKFLVPMCVNLRIVPEDF